MKYIVTLQKKGRSRAKIIVADSDEAAKAHAEAVMVNNNWRKAKLYYNDCITPDMEDGYLLCSVGDLIPGTKTVQWKETNYKTI